MELRKNVFGDKGLPPNQNVYEKKLLGLPQKIMVPILACLSVPVIAWLLASYKAIGGGETFLGDQNIVNVLFKIVGVAVLIYLIAIMMKATADERKKLIMAVLITFFMTIFWGFHELSGSVITLFADRNVQLDGIMNASQTNSLNALVIILLSIPVSLLWTFLSKRNLNPRTPFKFGMGLVLAGISFYVLSISGNSANSDGLVPFLLSVFHVLYFICRRIIYVSCRPIKNYGFVAKTYYGLYDGCMVLVFYLCFSNSWIYFKETSN